MLISFSQKPANIYLIQILLHDSTHLEIEAAVTMPVKLSHKNRQFPHPLNLGTSVTSIGVVYDSH
jgi:hypothetical protein